MALFQSNAICISCVGLKLSITYARKLCETFGTITKIHIPGKEGKSSYGYVTYELTSAADKAVKNLNGTYINGGIIYAFQATTNKERMVKMKTVKIERHAATICVGNINKNTSRSNLIEVFQKYGSIINVNIGENFIAYVTFQNEVESHSALQGNDPWSSWTVWLHGAKTKDNDKQPAAGESTTASQVADMYHRVSCQAVSESDEEDVDLI